MRYEILNDEGEVVNTIVADQAFMDENYPGAYREAAPAEPTIDQLVPQYDQLVQDRLHQHAQSMGYTDMDRAVTYADEAAVPKFQAEGRLLRAWRSRYWAACWPILEAVRAGERAVPEAADLLAELDLAAPPPTAADVAAEITKLTT